MNRAGLLIALAVAAITGIAFALFPQLDITIARFMHDKFDPGFLPAGPFVQFVRDAASWIVALIAAPAFLAVALKLLLPRRPMIIPARAAVLMIVTLVLAPGVLTNLVLKDYWGRPRPVELTQFGGKETFVPWWDPRGPCRNNCSFVAGEPSGAFWTMSAASYAPLPWRPYAYGAAIAFGLAVGALRMAFGGHFFSDVIFAGVFTFLIIWLIHALLYRWLRISDETLEYWIGAPTRPIYDALFPQKKRPRS